jgi:DNA-binding FadR family transcriptional regulator
MLMDMSGHNIIRRAERLHEQVVDVLIRDVVSGAIRPGQLLPSEQRLVETFGTSRTVVREALRVLSTTGLVQVEHGRGARVLPREKWDIFDVSVIRGLKSGSLMPIFEDLLEVRRFIEVETAALAALRAGPDNIRRLEATIDSMEASIAAPAEYFRQDVELHSQLLHAAHNRVLERLIEPVRDLLMAAKQQVIAVSSEQSLGESLEGHRRIVHAVRCHDAEMAREAMRVHLLLAETDLKRAATKLDAEGDGGSEARISVAGI